jgi:hypothetical protein
MAASWMGPAGRPSTTCSPTTATRSASCRTQPCRWRATPTRAAGSWTTRTARSCWSATPTAGPSSPQAGTHDSVAALVYIAAFAPDKGESVNTLIANPPPGAPVPPILPPKDGFLLLDREKFHGLPAEQAAFMADSQVPWAWTPSADRSPTRPGGPSRAGTCSRPRIG